MVERGVPKSCLVVCEARDDSLRAMYFGISCAFFAFKYWSEQSSDDQKYLETRDEMLWSAQLLGFLVWKEVKSIEKSELLTKLEAAEREIIELKTRRSEEAKANEKVAGMYAAQEQSWFAERRNLRHQIGVLLNDLRILEKRKNEAISELNGKLREMELSMKSKDKVVEEEEKKRKEWEEKIKSVEADVEELSEAAKREAQDHSSELLKHRTAFIELVSNQRQLKAELGRALRQLEAAKQQLDFVFEEKEEAVLMVQQLSTDIEKMSTDSEQKDKILSVMMRKSKLDSAEKRMLLKEVKLLKPKRKKAEIEAERWRTISGSRNGRRSLRNMLSRQCSSRLQVFLDERGGDSFATGLPDVDSTKPQETDSVFDGLDSEVRKDPDDYCLHLEQCLPEETTKFDEATRLDEWVHSEAENYHNAVEKRHQLELDSFAEQMRMKDNKLEAYKWRLLSTELDSKRLQSQIEVLNEDMSHLRNNNLKLEALLLDREVELKSLKDQIALQLRNLSAQKTKFHSSRHEAIRADDTTRPKFKIVKTKAVDKEQEQQAKKNFEVKKEDETQSISKDTSSTVLSSTEDIEEKEALAPQSLPTCMEVSSSPEGFETTGKEIAAKLCSNNREKSPWKIDLHALGVSYKIRRLNQQLLMLERLTGKQENGEFKGSEEREQRKMKGFILLLSLLNKQVSRYQSLQEKTDDLSKRMGETDLYVKRGPSSSTRKREETRTLEHFLEETFQLQRFIVATGQKITEIQSKIASGFVGIADELNKLASFDMKRFADTIQSLFKDVQRGLEVRISRIIGDLEGTLACDGFHSWE